MRPDEVIEEQEDTVLLPPLDDDDEDDDYDDVFEDDTLSDEEVAKLKKQQWFMVRIENYNSAKLKEIDVWCRDNCLNGWERVGWSSGCAYFVGVQFEDQMDATFFKMRWK